MARVFTRAFRACSRRSLTVLEFPRSDRTRGHDASAVQVEVRSPRPTATRIDVPVASRPAARAYEVGPRRELAAGKAPGRGGTDLVLDQGGAKPGGDGAAVAHVVPRQEPQRPCRLHCRGRRLRRRGGGECAREVRADGPHCVRSRGQLRAGQIGLPASGGRRRGAATRPLPPFALDQRLSKLASVLQYASAVH